LRNLCDTISTMGGSLESDLTVLTNILNEDLSDYADPDDKLVVSPVENAAASDTQLTCLQLPTPDALTRSGDFGGHNERGITRIFHVHALLDLLAFCRPSPPAYMSVISGSCRGALALFFASHESSFKVPSDCYTMATHCVLCPTIKRSSHIRKCPRCNEAPP
jgi:hypothetical protein